MVFVFVCILVVVFLGLKIVELMLKFVVFVVI